ncbi:MAG TPA: lipase family protein [Candidatus Limnocylindrales bacterium]|nr:lipase family protein [Candidatus Limnocylindrales bacterium]
MSTTPRPGPAARRWVGLGLGVVSGLAGALLVTRPFASLAVLVVLIGVGAIVSGLIEIAGPADGPNRRLSGAVGIGWILLGIAVLVWPGLGLRGLAIVVGAGLAVSGIARVAGAVRAEPESRAAEAVLGAASAILGLVALGWPDITLLVVALVFGVRLLLFGLARVGDAVRPTAVGDGPTDGLALGRRRRPARTAVAAAALVGALVIAAASVIVNRGVATPDAFYRPPSDVPPDAGRLLRSEPTSVAVPDGATVWRILYTTSHGDGRPAVASGLVAAPAGPLAGPRPVIAWAHGTTGVNESCAPSLLETGISSGSPNAIDEVIDNGWVMVATDYIGLGTAGPHAYLVGEPAGRAVLDAVRAAHELPDLDLSDQTAIWGHSQGGGAALWTGIVAPAYAPDVNVVGVAALSPASDLPSLVENLAVVTGGAVFASFAIEGYSGAYPDVRFSDYVRPTAQLQVREMASRCLTSESLVSIVQTLLFDKTIWSTDPLSDPLGRHLAENVPARPIPAPVLIGQGAADTLILPSAQAAYVDARCAAGQRIDYRTYPGEDHISVVEPDSPLIPELIAWTRDRFEGKPPTPTC